MISNSGELVGTRWGAVRGRGEAAVHNPAAPHRLAAACVTAHHATAVARSGPSLHVCLQQM